MTKREQIARALIANRYPVLGACLRVNGKIIMSPDIYSEALASADVALDCLTSPPTERMISAGLRECTHAVLVMDADDVGNIWEAMVRVMIEEGKS